jgi:hypothetical protein
LSVICNILLRNGSTLSGHELSYDMQVDDTPFIHRVSDGNAKRIRKCVREGFIAEQVSSVLYDEVYRLIANNRQRRGFPTTMTRNQLQRMVATFPDRLHYFAVFRNESRAEMLAAAVCISITDSILYVLYWGDAAGVEQHSPVTLLASCIYDFCGKRGFQLLDVGTSTVMGEPNDGLIRFKRALGFSETLKLTFSLQEAA